MREILYVRRKGMIIVMSVIVLVSIVARRTMAEAAVAVAVAVAVVRRQVQNDILLVGRPIPTWPPEMQRVKETLYVRGGASINVNLVIVLVSIVVRCLLPLELSCLNLR